MPDAFHISASSMHAQQTHIDVIANNLANVNTTGFKKSRVEFEDLIYRELHLNNGLLRPDLENPLGTGSIAASIEKIFSQGETRSTERNLDVAIVGDGFLELLLPDGSYAYTRTGHLQVDEDGMLGNADGHLLSPAIHIPEDATDVVITADGEVLAEISGGPELIEIGRIELAAFTNPAGLTPLGENLYVPSDDSGSARYGDPGEEKLGTLEQGFLEGSNVNMIEELTNLMVAQRAYGMNAKVIQAADEMLGIVNNLRR